MKKRLFIGIPLPGNILVKIQKLEKTIDKHLPWLPIENLHITLVFLGWLEEEYVGRLSQFLQQLKRRSFKLIIDKIDYSPGAKRMIWLYLRPNPQLIKFQPAIERLLATEKIPFAKEEREYLSHINLVRLRGADKKELAQDLNWKFEAAAINLYESILPIPARLRRGEQKPFARYEILTNVKLAHK